MADEISTTNSISTDTASTKPLLLLPANGKQKYISETTASEDRIKPKLYTRRWFMLILFCSYSLTNAFQWIHLSIIGNIIHRYYNESLPGDQYQQQLGIEWLSMVYMLVYIPLIFPATWILDKKGLRVAGILGTGINALGAWLKCASISPDRFGVLMFAQTVCAIAQIFILGLPPRLAAVWFGPNEVSTATAIGVFGNQLGNGVGFLLPPVFVKNDPNLDVVGHGLTIMFYGTAALTTLLFIIVCIVFKKCPDVPPSQAQAKIVEDAAHENYIDSLKRLISNPGFILLMLSYGLNTGSFYGISTQLNPLVLKHFPGEEQNAGRIGLTIVLTGIVASILAGIWLDKTKTYKWTTAGLYIFAFISMIVFTFTTSTHIWVIFVVAGALGFFMTGYLPVGFEFGAEITYPESEGTSSGLLNASAQLFGIILTLGMGALLKYGTLAPCLLVAGALLVGCIMTILIKSDLRRQKAESERENEMKTI
ncbi:unnamed protein product [Owenia fusiformis]|uniref:Choline/ethanolamine transporter FLVCR1 n=1 Tax=Owenia fusiformis TaxID=6347 RepID=A0A8J1TAI9_OWEFU|nr:unnamed protein product [Owenia fusiformis]